MNRVLTGFVASIALLAVGCLAEEVPEDQVGQDESQLTNIDIQDQNIAIGQAGVDPVWQTNLSQFAKDESDAWNWNRGPYVCYNSSYCYCANSGYSWGNRCNSSRDTWFITPGWGDNFQYYHGQPGPYGWSFAGQHPYWCPSDNNTWQGWSTDNHC
jgi:hypothetical protein